MKRALVFGALNIDYVYGVDHFVQKGETILSENIIVNSGGKGLNQAVALGRAEVPMYIAGNIGEDGMFLIEKLKDANVNTRLLKISPNIRTGNAIIQNDISGDNSIILYGGANQVIEEDYIDEVLNNFQKGDFLVLQNEINQFESLVMKGKTIGMQIVLNPSPINEKITEQILENVDYLFLNEVEAAQILNDSKAEMGGVELIQRLSEKFTELKIVLTLGSQGSIYKDKDLMHSQKGYKVKAIDSTGAGDTFTGYFVGALMRNESVVVAMEQATRAAAISVQRKGAAQSVPDYREMKEFCQ